MNHSTELNSELLSADARGKKHIPFAVFAVILIHVILFVVLLIAAGCRSSARAKANQPAVEPAQQVHPAEKYMQAAANSPVQPLAAPVGEPVMATEPVLAEDGPLASLERQPQNRPNASAYMLRTSPKHPREQQGLSRRHVAGSDSRRSAAPQPTIHVVQSGDTVGEIARRHGTTVEAIKAANKLKGHLIYPGQKLLVKPTPAGSTAQVKKGNLSNEV